MNAADRIIGYVPCGWEWANRLAWFWTQVAAAAGLAISYNLYLSLDAFAGKFFNEIKEWRRDILRED